jgi:hypothetical protein
MCFLRLDLSGFAETAAGPSVDADVVPEVALVLASAADRASSVTAVVSNRNDVLKSSSNLKSISMEGMSSAGRLGRLLRLSVLWPWWLGDKGEITLTPEGRLDKVENRSGVECER